MTFLPGILASDCVQRLGWVLIHSLWQGSLIVLALTLVLAALRNRSSNVRYLVAYAGLLLMLALPLATYCIVDISSSLGDVTLPTGTSYDGATAVAGQPRDLDDGQNNQRTSLSWNGPAEVIAQSSRWLQEALAPCMPWLTTVWFVGALSLSLWHLGGWFAVQRLKRSGVAQEIDPLLGHLERLATRMQVSRSVRLLQSAVVEVPVVVGWLRPVVLLPATMATGLPPSQLAAVLAHELAHVRRHDYLFNLLQTVIETLLFYHPATWWISRQIRIEREHCCDDLAIAAGVDRVEYAAVLAGLEQARLGLALALAAGGCRREGSTLRRVRRVLVRPGSDHAGMRVWLAGALTILLAASFGAAAALSWVALPLEVDRQYAVSPDVAGMPSAIDGLMPKSRPGETTVDSGKGKTRTLDHETQSSLEAPSL